MDNRVKVSTPAFADVIDLVARFETFRVADRLYNAEFLIPQLTIRLKDLLVEAAACPAHILYWGLEVSRARRHHASVEAAYRTWRDRLWMGMKTGAVAPEAKVPSDALCEKMYRTNPEYGAWQKRQADAQEGLDCAQAVLEAFKAKAQLIKIEEQLLRDESAGPFYVVEEQPAGQPRRPQTGGANV